MAGVSRSSFFNYFSSKSDVLWSGLDERIAAATERLQALGSDVDGEHVHDHFAQAVHLGPDERRRKGAGRTCG